MTSGVGLCGRIARGTRPSAGIGGRSGPERNASWRSKMMPRSGRGTVDSVRIDSTSSSSRPPPTCMFQLTIASIVTAALRGADTDTIGGPTGVHQRSSVSCCVGSDSDCHHTLGCARHGNSGGRRATTRFLPFGRGSPSICADADVNDSAAVASSARPSEPRLFRSPVGQPWNDVSQRRRARCTSA
jgi:hypothetical protein